MTNTNLYKMLERGEPIPEWIELNQTSKEDAEKILRLLLHPKDESQDLSTVDGEE